MPGAQSFYLDPRTVQSSFPPSRKHAVRRCHMRPFTPIHPGDTTKPARAPSGSSSLMK